MGTTPAPSKALEKPITVNQLTQLFPDAAQDYLSQVVAELNANLTACALNTPLRQAHFFAQVMQESGPSLEVHVESLKYKPDVLVKMFKYYRLHPDEAEQDGYTRDPNTGKITKPASEQAIGNKAYASRNGNGDVASGDGFRFRGRGFIQVTGRGNYANLARQYKVTYGNADVDFEKNPELLEAFPHTVRSAVCYWLENGLPTLADKGSDPEDVDAITAVINKSTDSYEQRRANFKKTFGVFQQ